MTDLAPYNEDEIEALGQEFEALEPLFAAMLSDIRELSKKKPDGILNARKIETVNRILVDLLRILDREASRPYLDMIDQDDVPQYSDVALLLGQVSAAMSSFKEKYYRPAYKYGPDMWLSVDYDEEDYNDEQQDDDSYGS